LAKLTVHAHSSLVQTAELYAGPILGIAEDDVVFSAAKLFFAYGLGNALTFPMSVGASTVLVEKVSPPELMAAVQRFGATVMFAMAVSLATALVCSLLVIQRPMNSVTATCLNLK
jgi:benzoate-CoA ligase